MPSRCGGAACQAASDDDRPCGAEEESELRASETHSFWLYDGADPVEHWENQGSWELVEEYVWGPQTQQMFGAARSLTGDLVYPITDERQSISAVWHEPGAQIVEYRQYDPDGRMRVRGPDDNVLCDEQEFDADVCEPGWLDRFGYTGAMRSEVTGLHRFGERWYSSLVGQFLRTDPLWYVDSPDMYGYVGFDPINRWDPTGLAAMPVGPIDRRQATMAAITDPSGVGIPIGWYLAANKDVVPYLSPTFNEHLAAAGTEFWGITVALGQGPRFNYTTKTVILPRDTFLNPADGMARDKYSNWLDTVHEIAHYFIGASQIRQHSEVVSSDTFGEQTREVRQHRARGTAGDYAFWYLENERKVDELARQMLIEHEVMADHGLTPEKHGNEVRRRARPIARRLTQRWLSSSEPVEGSISETTAEEYFRDGINRYLNLQGVRVRSIEAGQEYLDSVGDGQLIRGESGAGIGKGGLGVNN